MSSPPDQTNLVITGIGGLPLYSSFNAEQTLDYIEAAKNLERDLNGNLIDLTRPELRKYTTTISTREVMTPAAMDGIWPGMQVVIDCIVPLIYPAGGSPQRPSTGVSWPIPDGAFTAYLPRLTCLIEDFTVNFDEWGARVGWTLKASEV